MKLITSSCFMLATWQQMNWWLPKLLRKASQATSNDLIACATACDTVSISAVLEKKTFPKVTIGFGFSEDAACSLVCSYVLVQEVRTCRKVMGS